jgi:hypothetical protein
MAMTRTDIPVAELISPTAFKRLPEQTYDKQEAEPTLNVTDGNVLADKEGTTGSDEDSSISSFLEPSAELTGDFHDVVSTAVHELHEDVKLALQAATTPALPTEGEEGEEGATDRHELAVESASSSSAAAVVDAVDLSVGGCADIGVLPVGDVIMETLLVGTDLEVCALLGSHTSLRA